jgi:hypothetical protein
MRWAGYAACMGNEKCIQNFGQKTWSLGRLRCRWEDIIEMDLKATNCELLKDTAPCS